MKTPLDAHTTLYTHENAAVMAWAANLAYEKEEDIAQACENQGWRMERFIDHAFTETQGFVATTSDAILVAFRGTQTIADWMRDAKITPKAGPLGNIHRGFLDAWRSVDGNVSHAIRTAKQEAPHSLWITGHSLGGALAVVCAADLAADGEPVDGVYTFGQPRVGDTSFARTFDMELGNRYFRFVNNNDVVTRVPTRSMGYRHGGVLRYFDENGDLHEDIGWWHRFLDRVHGRLEDFLKPGTDGINDHSMDDYERLVRNALDEDMPVA